MSYRVRFHLGLAADRLRSLVGVPLECGGRGSGEEHGARESPPGALRFLVGGREALLCYGRPAARGRTVFGGLVPWGDLWRLGANEPTVLHLPFSARVAGVRVRRGKVALYAVPAPTGWTLVLNRSTRQWGLTRPERGADGVVYQSAYTGPVRGAELGRVPVETRSTGHVERLTASAERESDRRSVLLLEWETTQLRIPIEV